MGLANKPPMTKAEAVDFVSQMVLKTSKRSRVRMLQLGLEIGNLSADARRVYADQLVKDNANV